MPKKDYRKAGAIFTAPQVTAHDDGVNVTFDAFNTAGNKIRLTVLIYNTHLPHLIKEFVRIAGEKQEVAGIFLRKLKEAAL